MERDSQSRNGLLAWLLLLAAAVALQLVSNFSRSITCQVAAVFALAGTLTAAVAWFQMRLAARETAERLELEDLARSKAGSALFAGSSDDALHAKRARALFERIVVPAFTVVLFLFQAASTWWFSTQIRAAVPPIQSSASLAMAILAGLGLVVFLVGSYASRLARYEGLHLLRPGASALLLCSLLCAVATGVEAAAYFGYARYDTHAAWVLLGILGVVAAETLVGLVFEIYRPRVQGREVRMVYESRLIGILGSSGGLFTTAAQALDYQFGFKVSDTWFYKFLEQAIGRLALVWLGILWFSTCFVVIEPPQQGLLERFGRPVASGVLNPGLHVTFPWPIDQVHVVPVQQLQSFAIGYETDPARERERTVLWTVAHYKEETPMLVASADPAAATVEGAQAVPVSLLMVSIPVQYYIDNVRDWAYQHANAGDLLRRIANREVVKYLVGVDMVEIMSAGRLAAADQLRQRIQARADQLKLGVKITFVGLQDIHPPIGNKEIQVAAAFEKEVGAQAQKEATIHEAEAYRARLLPRAQADAAKIVNDSRALAIRRVAEAEGQARQFAGQLQAHQAAPTLFRERTRLETTAKAIAPARKLVVLSDDDRRVVQIDLQNKIRDDLTDVPIESPNRPEPAVK